MEAELSSRLPESRYESVADERTTLGKRERSKESVKGVELYVRSGRKEVSRSGTVCSREVEDEGGGKRRR